MAELEDYSQIFASANVSYTAQRIDAITRHRRELNDTLFFDRLLKTVGIEQPSKFYPPKNSSDLKKLYTRVGESQSPLHHKQSLIYYLLLDLADNHGHGNAGQYSFEVGLPRKYITLMHGLWYMDQLDFKHALESLTCPSLVPTFTEETLVVLCDHPKSDPSLVLAYFHTVAPEIQSREVLDKVFGCMCKSSITEAFFFSRQQGVNMHRHLLNELIKNVLTSKADPATGEMAEELIKLPLKVEEEKWFEEFLTLGDGQTLDKAKDVLIMRHILMGKMEDAERVASSTKQRTIDGVNWSSLLQVK